MVDLGYIFRRAWEITWRHKALWVFGLCAGLGTISARLGAVGLRWDRRVVWLPPQAQRALTELARGPYAWIAWVAFVLLALALSLGRGHRSTAWPRPFFHRLDAGLPRVDRGGTNRRGGRVRDRAVIDYSGTQEYNETRGT